MITQLPWLDQALLAEKVAEVRRESAAVRRTRSEQAGSDGRKKGERRCRSPFPTGAQPAAGGGNG
ncbi:hypothetical protein [Oceanithermus sp.]